MIDGYPGVYLLAYLPILYTCLEMSKYDVLRVICTNGMTDDRDQVALLIIGDEQGEERISQSSRLCFWKLDRPICFIMVLRVRKRKQTQVGGIKKGEVSLSTCILSM